MAESAQRINRGRGHSYLLDGAPADGVTWIIGNGVPKPALVAWAARMSAGYAVDNWAELERVGASEKLRRIERARFDAMRGASVRGTDVHQLALKLAAGEEVEVPEPLVGHVDAYLRFIEEWQPVEILAEAVVGNRQHRYMGTIDSLAHVRGEAWLLDWKTGASGIWPEAALQLAAYRNADFYLGENGAELPMPRVDRTGCVWLRADGYDLVPVETGPAVVRTFLYAQQVARFTAEPREAYVLEALEPPVRT